MKTVLQPILAGSMSLFQQNAAEESCQWGMGTDRQDMGDILVGTYEHQAPIFPIYLTHIENVRTVFQIDTEHLFTVDKAEHALLRLE